MWVADMGIRRAVPPDAVLTAEIQRAIHGYYADTGKWAAALVDWMARRHSLGPPSDLVSCPGSVILQAVSAPGDEVVIFPPAYHAFRKIIVANERRIRRAACRDRRPLRNGSRCVAAAS